MASQPMSGLVATAEANQGYAQGFGFLAGLADGGPITPNDLAFQDFLSATITQVGAPASSVLAAMNYSANVFLADPSGVNDAVAQAMTQLKSA
jgi:hypothetical protein